MKKIWVLGLGPGAPEYITPDVQRHIAQCDLLVGGTRQLKSCRCPNQETMELKYPYDETFRRIEGIGDRQKQSQNQSQKPTPRCSVHKIHEKRNKQIEKQKESQVGIVVSGDPGFYSLLHTLLDYFSRDRLEVFPGISSFQYLCARIVMPWQEFTLKSLHGTPPQRLAQWASQHKKLALLTDPKHPFPQLAEILINAGFGERRAVLGERLSYKDERITEGKINRMADTPSDPLSVVLIYET
jgi:cobalt-precorrin-7 (C5)-methyltransferase